MNWRCKVGWHDYKATTTERGRFSWWEHRVCTRCLDSFWRSVG